MAKECACVDSDESFEVLLKQKVEKALKEMEGVVVVDDVGDAYTRSGLCLQVDATATCCDATKALGQVCDGVVEGVRDRLTYDPSVTVGNVEVYMQHECSVGGMKYAIRFHVKDAPEESDHTTAMVDVSQGSAVLVA